MTNETNEPSAAYLAACRAHDAAWIAYDVACIKYRARAIDDAEYFEARKLYDAATAAFDAAYALETSSD